MRLKYFVEDLSTMQSFEIIRINHNCIRVVIYILLQETALLIEPLALLKLEMEHLCKKLGKENWIGLRSHFQRNHSMIFVYI